MQIIGDIFNEIQDCTSIPNKVVFTLISEYEKHQTQFINALEQCYLKILKSMLSLKMAPKKQFEIYEKLTDKFFSTLHTEYIKNTSEKNLALEKADIFSTFGFFFLILFFISRYFPAFP